MPVPETITAIVDVSRYYPPSIDDFITLSGEFILTLVSGKTYYKYTEAAPGPTILYKPLYPTDEGDDTYIKVSGPYEGTGPYTLFDKTVVGNYVLSFVDGDYGGTGTVVISGFGPGKPINPLPGHGISAVRLGWPTLIWESGS